jgi:signal transduction histidine kinase
MPARVQARLTSQRLDMQDSPPYGVRRPFERPTLSRSARAVQGRPDREFPIRMTMATPFVIALRGALALLAAAPAEPSEAAVAKKIVREIEQSLARFEGREGTEADLISIVCHDLKDPLASIVMGAGFLRKTVSADDSAARRVVDAIARSTDRMSQVISDFHDLAKLEAGRVTLDLRAWDVTAILRGALPTFEPRARERGVRLELEVPPEPLVALCDRARVLQVVSKLVGNAIKFTGAEGRVVISAVERGENVRIAVTDTGRGIPPDRLTSIFDHAANARRTPRDGPGLGLAIAQGLLVLQASKIDVESHVENGSVFSFLLPLSTAAPSGPLST